MAFIRGEGGRTRKRLVDVLVVEVRQVPDDVRMWNGAAETLNAKPTIAISIMPASANSTSA
jgi:hypothetical protein